MNCEPYRTIRVDGCGDVTVTRNIHADAVNESGQFMLVLRNAIGMDTTYEFGEMNPARQAEQISAVALTLANGNSGVIGGLPSRMEPNRGVADRGVANRGEPSRCR